MMAQSTYRVRSLGDYVVGKQLGSGSYSVVWHARHKVLGTEVAIKEILTARLDKKLEECLISEIDILRNINHPNIIRLHDMIKEPGKIHLVLEYCEGGDLSMFIHRRQGRIPESTAVHFMKQLAAGLKILRDNQIIHRDLKPQNLLLCTNEDNSTLKIADFGFARSLQSRGLAETLCGSPLYMAPEIMQLQKYDAKADLWSVGAILFQVVTGRTPFAGINQIQLLQNIMKSNELQFPPNVKDLSSDCMDLCRKLLRQNPVERLTFEEFFSHPFFTRQPVELSRNMKPLRVIDGFTSPESAAFKNKGGSQDDGGHDGRPTSVGRSPPRSFTLADSLELIDEDYVIVSGPLGDASFSLASVSKLSQLTSASGIPPLTYRNIHSTSSAPILIIGGTTHKMGCSGSLESRPSGTPHGSIDIVDASEQLSTHLMEMIKSLKHYASAITELVYEKIEAGQQLEAFSIQLVILAIWKQALDICRTQAASAIESSPSQETMRLKESTSKDRSSPDIQECLEAAKSPKYVCCHIERIFLGEVENAEELAKVIEPGNVGMPDAMETIFQAALTFGKHGAVDECMGFMESASTLYSKAVCLLSFLLVEAPSLVLNPPFSISKSDSHRLRTYIDVLSNRQRYSRSRLMALLNTGDTILPDILHC